MLSQRGAKPCFLIIYIPKEIVEVSILHVFKNDHPRFSVIRYAVHFDDVVVVETGQ